MEWNITDVDMIDLIHESIDSMRQLFTEKEIELNLRLPGEAPLVAVDRDRVQQVILNLLANAIKFCAPEDGKVGVQLRTEPTQLCVDVIDNGIGIPTEAQTVIFDKFGQVGHAANGKPQGTGLGLPISRSIIAHFDGELSVRSKPGAGATFTFTLPLRNS